MAEDLEFAPYMQSSIGAAISTTVPDGPAVISPVLTLLGPDKEVTVQPPLGDLRMLGPEGAIGIDTRRVARVDPPPGIQDTEPNYMPCIEFDAPELPWLFTPARADDAGRLRPWLVLVALETAGHPLQSGRALPFVDVDTAALPSLGQSWQWGHVQRPAGRSEPLISRLLCPLRLKSDTDYTACVVPAFQGGVVAGLTSGLTDAEPHGDAWWPGQGIVRLPVPQLAVPHRRGGRLRATRHRDRAVVTRGERPVGGADRGHHRALAVRRAARLRRAVGHPADHHRARCAPAGRHSRRRGGDRPGRL
jgi:hypothetical protein